MFGLTPKKLLGLDIGNRAVKGAVLSRKGKEVILKDLVYYDFREAVGGAPNDDERTEILHGIVDARGLSLSSVACCLEDKEVQVMELQLPKMPDAEIEAAVRLKVESKTGIEASLLAMDYLIVAEQLISGTPTLIVQVYYVPMEMVRTLNEFLEYLRLRPLSLESSMQATLEALRFNGYVSPHDTCVIADIGETHTSLGLIIGGNLKLLNTIRRGSGDINESLMDSFQCDYAKSEEMKVNYRLEKSDPGSAENMNRVIEDGYYQLILGIHDTITYYRATHRDQLFVNLLLTGGGSQKDGLPALLEQSLGLPVEVANPLRNIQIYGPGTKDAPDLPKLAPRLAPAIGLALRGL